MGFKIEKAQRKKLKSRILLQGVSGSGKTYSALVLARSLGKKIIVIDTEDNSACLYENLCDFDVINMQPPYSPNNLVMAISQCESEGYDVIVVDSLTAFWAMTGGALEMVNKTANTQGKNSYTAWGDITPLQNKMIDKILHCKSHIICTARVKTDYVMEDYVSASGKTCQRPVKVGLKTIQREGLEYEFTIVFDVDRHHIATVDKTRADIFDGFSETITDEVGKKLLNWLDKGISQDQEQKQEQEQDLTPIAEKLITIKTIDELTKYFGEFEKMTPEIKQLFTSRKEAILKEGEK